MPLTRDEARIALDYLRAMRKYHGNYWIAPCVPIQKQSLTREWDSKRQTYIQKPHTYTQHGKSAKTPVSALKTLQDHPQEASAKGAASPQVAVAIQRGEVSVAGLERAYRDVLEAFAGPAFPFLTLMSWDRDYRESIEKCKDSVEARLMGYIAALEAKPDAPEPALLPEEEFALV